jgi:formylglycine-generating enzyme required for sulfatase activity
MIGNVQEWTLDCSDDSRSVPLSGTPINGSAYRGGDCSFHVLRGGGTSGDREDLRSASRFLSAADNRNETLGFRVGRTLATP